MIEILMTMPLATVQDLGRNGQRAYGVGRAGAMDSLALRAGNRLLGNPETAAAIEITIPPFRCRFEEPVSFVLTGCTAEAALDGAPLPAWRTCVAGAGQELKVTRLPDGARTYLCLAGGIAVPEILGSRSTQLRGAIGGFQGRGLAKGDRIPVFTAAAAVSSGLAVAPPRQALQPVAAETGVIDVRAIPAGEHDWFTPASREAFWGTAWTVTPQSNRTGYRLSGETLHLDRPAEMNSHGILPGVVQVPPGGQPIVQMADANVSGGYPKIATVIGADLWRLGQARAQEKIRFHRVSPAQALQARDEVEAYLARLDGLHA